MSLGKIADLYCANVDDIADSEGWTAYHLMNAQVKSWPFPHVAFNSPLRPDVFALLHKFVPSNQHFRTLNELGRVSASYPTERKVVPGDVLRELPYWSAFMKWFRSERFFAMMLAKFNVVGSYPADVLLCQDAAGYVLGPHTDAPHKVLSMIIYLGDELRADPTRGTHLYLPRQYGFTCAGGPHYNVENFVRIRSIPYARNRAFAFRKTANSFHGVERASEPRTVLIYDIRN